jgi:hypothetical protein
MQLKLHIYSLISQSLQVVQGHVDCVGKAVGFHEVSLMLNLSPPPIPKTHLLLPPGTIWKQPADGGIAGLIIPLPPGTMGRLVSENFEQIVRR